MRASTRARYDFAVKRVIRVVDGDTVDLLIDVGFRVTLLQRVRLAVIDTPERGKPGYDDATVFLASWLVSRAELRVSTYREDSFGRWVADVYDDTTGDNASAALLAAGLAKLWS